MKGEMVEGRSWMYLCGCICCVWRSETRMTSLSCTAWMGRSMCFEYCMTLLIIADEASSLDLHTQYSMVRPARQPH